MSNQSRIIALPTLLQSNSWASGPLLPTSSFSFPYLDRHQDKFRRKHPNLLHKENINISFIAKDNNQTQALTLHLALRVLLAWNAPVNAISISDLSWNIKDEHIRVGDEFKWGVSSPCCFVWWCCTLKEHHLIYDNVLHKMRIDPFIRYFAIELAPLRNIRSDRVDKWSSWLTIRW